MLKRGLIMAVLALAACGQTASHDHSHEDDFLTQLQADYPVTLAKVADDVWVHTTNYILPGQNPIASNGLVVIDRDDVILVDGAWGELATLSLLEKIKAETGKSVTKMIVTHHRSDRVAGVDAAEWQGIQIFTHPDTPTLAAQNGWPVPNTSVAALKEPTSRTKIGNIELAYPGPGHAQDNLVVYIPSAKILFGGSAVRGAGATVLGNMNAAELNSWAESLAWMKATYPETELVVPARGKGANLSLIDATIALIKAETDEADAAP